MIDSVRKVIASPNQIGNALFADTCEIGLRIENQTVPFGTILERNHDTILLKIKVYPFPASPHSFEH